MRKTDLIRLACRHLSSLKMRTFLTVLGIAVGTGALMSVIALGTGGRKLLDYEMNRLGTNRIWVNVEANTGGSLEFGHIKQLSQIEEDAVISALKTTYCVVSAGKGMFSVKTTGCQQGIFEITNMVQVSGRFFNERDSARQTRAAVINSALAEKLFGGRQAAGNVIKVDGISFIIVGVVSSKESSFADTGDECALYMPIETFFKDIGKGADMSADQVTMTVMSGDIMDTAQRVVDFLARANGSGVYRATTMESEIEVANRVMDIFFTIIGSIAVVCMIVGGIGIMNMMVSSVRERKKEIGVMLAVGATPAAIFIQTLAESTVMSMIGASAGIAVGVCFTAIGSAYVGMSFSMPLWAVAASIVFSALIGMFFGAYPAYKASKISPVEAMRA